jgi:hypothetical protein
VNATIRSVLVLVTLAMVAFAKPGLKIGTFKADVTPPLGSLLCCEGGVKPAEEIVDPLTARGIILLGGAKPVVLIAVDRTGIATEGWDEWRLARTWNMSP